MVDLTNRFFEDMTHIDKINFILCFEEIVNIRCFCACHVLYFSFDQKNRSTTCDINFSFYLKCIESLLVCSSPSTYHQRQWLSSPISLYLRKERKFFSNCCFKTSFFCSTYITFFSSHKTGKREIILRN